MAMKLNEYSDPGEMMTVRIDVNEHRYYDVLINGLTGIDDVYTLYYDETNNVRRLHVRPDGLNVKDPQCFVLGGVGHTGTARDLDIGGLRRSLHIQPSAKEIKFEQIAHGEFHKLIGSNKLTAFLHWVKDQGLLVHYFALDPLYWSMVDIIDSIAGAAADGQLMMYAPHLKNDLYTIFRHDIAWTVNFYQRHAYPNIAPEGRLAFLRELIDRLSDCEDLLPHFNYQMLRGVLQMGKKLDELVFIENETPHVLIDEFTGFFLKRISLFKTSQHILDVEEVIREKFAGYAFENEGALLDIHHFVDSKSEPGVQVSDVVVGVLGKVFSFATHTSRDALNDFRRSLSASQRANLALLGQLTEDTIDFSAAFAHRVISIEDEDRVKLLLQR